MEETHVKQEEPPLPEVAGHPMTPRGLLDFQSPGIQDRAIRSSLYDRHELKALLSHLGQALNPAWTPSPRVTSASVGSTLYDSHELKAVAKQLNGALLATRSSASAHSKLRCLDHLHKKGRRPKPLEGTQDDVFGDQRNGILRKMWKKLKKAILKMRAA